MDPSQQDHTRPSHCEKPPPHKQSLSLEDALSSYSSTGEWTLDSCLIPLSTDVTTEDTIEVDLGNVFAGSTFQPPLLEGMQLWLPKQFHEKKSKPIQNWFNGLFSSNKVTVTTYKSERRFIHFVCKRYRTYSSQVSIYNLVRTSPAWSGLDMTSPDLSGPVQTIIHRHYLITHVSSHITSRAKVYTTPPQRTREDQRIAVPLVSRSTSVQNTAGGTFWLDPEDVLHIEVIQNQA